MATETEVRPVTSKALIIFGVILSIGIVVAALIFSNTIKQVAPSSESITVKGLKEQSVKADNARWQLDVIAEGWTAKEAYEKLRNDQKTVIGFLKQQGFKDDQISVGIESAQEMYDDKRDEAGNYTRVFRGYQTTQSVITVTKDVMQMDAAAKQAFHLDESSAKVRNLQPEYLVSNLEEIKMSLIAGATENAYTRANEFAKSGKAKVGVMRSASQGAFYILSAQGGTDDGDYGGVYDKSSIDKIARVVVTINYGISQ